jgi:Protein of unknown function (DUF2808)
MNFSTSALSSVLAIAALVGTQSTVLATTKYDSITQPLITLPAQINSGSERISSHSSGQTFFNHPPSLIHVGAVQVSRNSPSTYEFTLTVPANAGQSLKAVMISQVENLETVSFDINQSHAFAGQRFAMGSEIPLASVGGERPAHPGDVTIVFDQPVLPGRTVTVAVKADSNPNYGGVYLFGVTAYPAGENSLGQFIGYGRIHFPND